MSKLIVEEVTTPDTNTDLTINPNGTGKTVIDGTLDMNGGELILDADADTSITADTDDQIDFKVGGSDKANITTNGVGVGTTPAGGVKLQVKTATDRHLAAFDNSAGPTLGAVTDAAASTTLRLAGSPLVMTGAGGSGAEHVRIDSNGQLLVGKTSATITTAGQTVYFGQINATRDGAQTCTFNRLSSDGVLIDLRQDNTQEGTISVSGSTVSYNGGHLSRWSQLTDGTEDTTIVKGTVMTNLDQMAVWTHAATDDEAEWTEDNEQLNCMAVSSVEGDANVAGVFVNWDHDDDEFNDMNVAMTGDMVIRIASGTTVARGDLLMSAGDGTAKPQGDDIVRSKTIAKVTSTNVSHTYDDGSYLVPCVLMAC